MRKLARVALYVGIVSAVLGTSKVHAAWIATEPYSWHSSFRFAWSLFYIGVLCAATYGSGLPDLASSRRSAFIASVVAPLTGALAISVLQLTTGDALLPRFVVFGTVVLVAPWALVCSAVAGKGWRLEQQRDRVLLVTSPEAAATLTVELDRAPEHPAAIVAQLSVTRVGGTSEDARPIIEAAIRSGATVVVLDHDAQADDRVLAQVAALHELGLRIRPLVDFYEEWLGKLPVVELERASMLFDIGEVHRARYARAKRLVDVPIAIIGTLVLAVAVPLVALGNFFGNRGPLFYRQQRVGMNGRPFDIVKFRSMRTDHDAPTDWTATDDPRVTRFGSILRRWHIDELPQTLNILRGDLAVVGPRPEQPHYVAELSEKLAFYDLRHLVHPGLTGWAQVKYGYAGDESDAMEKLQYEFYYLRHQSLRLDLRIMARTIRSVITRGGR